MARAHIHILLLSWNEKAVKAWYNRLPGLRKNSHAWTFGILK
ncbi:hypothetical protein VSDKYIMU_CDS0161 [Enterococcus phage VRE9_4]